MHTQNHHVNQKKKTIKIIRLLYICKWHALNTLISQFICLFSLHNFLIFHSSSNNFCARSFIIKTLSHEKNKFLHVTKLYKILILVYYVSWWLKSNTYSSHNFVIIHMKKVANFAKILQLKHLITKN